VSFCHNGRDPVSSVGLATFLMAGLVSLRQEHQKSRCRSCRGRGRRATVDLTLLTQYRAGARRGYRDLAGLKRGRNRLCLMIASSVLDVVTRMRDVKGEIVEPGNSWGSGEGWAKVMELIEIALRTEYKVSPRIRERVLQLALASVEVERLRNAERRRLVRRGVAAGACALVLAAVLLRLIAGWTAPGERRTPELAAKAVRARVAAE